MTEEGRRCMAAGMVAHLTKPVDMDHLVTTLLQQLPATGNRDDSEEPEMSPITYSPANKETVHDILPGIDMDGALKNLKCDLPTFRKILVTFYRHRL